MPLVISLGFKFPIFFTDFNTMLDWITTFTFLVLFCQSSIVWYISLGQKTVFQELLYLLRNPILQCSFPFPWSETSFPGVSTMNQTQKCRCCFSPAMSTNNNTYMLIGGLSSQPGAPGRRPACTLDPALGGWDKERLAGDGGGWVGRGRESFQTLWNLLFSDANEMEGARRQNNMQEKMDTKGRLGRNLAS